MKQDTVIGKFRDIVGSGHALDDTEDLSRYTHENRGIYIGRTPIVLKPASTGEVAAIVRLAAQTGTAIVPQGGHTGHAAGAVPDESGSQIVVSLERMNKVETIDPVEKTATVQAGVVLAQLQQAAREKGVLFPVSLGSQGSCQIGGNISTNAGGTAVLAYGNMREQVLGLEVVLPSGEIWNGLRRLRKDNSGYALKHLFIGAEGTLGIITRAVLRLYPQPKGREVVWVALPSPDHALRLFRRAQDEAGGGLTAFELIHRTPLALAIKHFDSCRDPFAEPHDWYVLAEISSSRSPQDAKETAEAIFAGALDDNLASDVVISQNDAQCEAFWKMREEMPVAQYAEGASIKHDISVPVNRIPQFIEHAGKLVKKELPGARLCVFGHMGDGNLHYNISQPVGEDPDSFMARRHHINAVIHDLVLELEGSISAEHGIGRIKREALSRTKSEVEMAMMRAVKQAIDPSGIMNPGKVL